MRFTKQFLPAAILFVASQAHAQTFNYLDDEAEVGGYDVTATFKKAPAQLSLAESEKGDGYLLKITPTALELDAQTSKKIQPLATVNQKLSPGEIVVQRRGPRWRVVAGGRVVLEAEDDRWREGKIGYMGGLDDVRVQPTEDINFADDFMRDAKAVLVKQAVTNETIWRATQGSWGTSGLTENDAAQVSQTANPFVFKTTSKGTNIALAGRPFWSDYTAEVSVKPEGASAIGLIAYAQDAKNYLLFRWEQNGPMQLRAIVDGKTSVLDETPGGFEQKQWYRFKFSASAGTLRAWVDDNEVLRARTGLFARGQVGIYAEAATDKDSASFDDVLVRSEDDFLDDFKRPVPGRWQNVSGGWKMANAATPTDMRGAFAVMGESDWSDYVVSAQITLPADTSAGLVLHHLAGKGAYWLRIAGSKAKLPYAGKAQIVRLAGGKATILGEAAIGSRFDGKTTEWNFSTERGYMRASAGETRIVDAFDDAGTTGRAGISAQSGATGIPRIADFEVTFPRVRQTWAKVPDLYEQDVQAQTMGGWSTPQGFWLTNSQRTGALVEAGSAPPKPGETLWHKGRFWGDDSIKFVLPAIPAGQTLDLMFAAVPAKGGAASPDAAMKLSFALDGSTLSAQLIKNGKDAAKKGELKITGAPTDQSIEVERRGSFIIVRANGKGEIAKTLLAARVI